jgi:hypothetical protein
LKPHVQTIGLLGGEVLVVVAADGTLRAEADGKPASAMSVQTYIARAFGNRRPEVRSHAGSLVRLPPKRLTRAQFANTPLRPQSNINERFQHVLCDTAAAYAISISVHQRIHGTCHQARKDYARHHSASEDAVAVTSREGQHEYKHILVIQIQRIRETPEHLVGATQFWHTNDREDRQH